jgi:hypothetical protein
VRILLSLLVVLSGLLMAREFMAHSNEQLRLTLRGAKVVSEQSIGTVREPPALVAPMAVARIAEVSAQSIATVHEPPALVARMTECELIWDQITHMTREEWAEACRRVDDEKQAGDK